MITIFCFRLFFGMHSFTNNNTALLWKLFTLFYNHYYVFRNKSVDASTRTHTMHKHIAHTCLCVIIMCIHYMNW